MKDKTLASVVKEAREKLGISQRELSRRTGIDNNTVAKIEKGERKKPNILSLRKLSVVLNLDYRNLMELCDYSKEEIKAIADNNYYSLAIRNKDASILMMEDLINLVQEQKYIKLVLKELLENCDVNNLKCLSELSKKEKIQVIKKLNEFVDANIKSIESHQNSIENLNEMLGNN